MARYKSYKKLKMVIKSSLWTAVLTLDQPKLLDMKHLISVCSLSCLTLRCKEVDINDAGCVYVASYAAAEASRIN